MTEKDRRDADIYHIIRKSGFAGILQANLISSPYRAPPNELTKIWNGDFSKKRSALVLPLPTKPKLSEFVPFFATCRPPALYNVVTDKGSDIKLHNRDLLLLRTSVRRLTDFLVPIAVADRQPLTADVEFEAGGWAIDLLDFEIILSGDFKQDPWRKAKMAAEVLAYGEVPLPAIMEVICSEAEEDIRDMIEAAGTSVIPVRRSSRHFFPRGE